VIVPAGSEQPIPDIKPDAPSETVVPKVVRTAPGSKPVPVAETTTAPTTTTSAPPVSSEGSLDVDMRVQQLPDYVEPSFDLRMLKKKLLSPDITFRQRFKLLLGLHYKMWHLSATEMKRFLLQGGFGPENAKLAWSVVDHCSVCKQWQRTKTKPTAALGTVASYFNERVQTDLFTLWGRTYVIFVDECIHWALSSFCPSKTADDWYRVFVTDWCRYFGPPRCLVSDQEGAVVSDLLSRACEAFDIDRDLAGSEGHTKTGLAERRLGVIKLGALKLWQQTQRQNLKLSQDECVMEAAMATNSVMVYNAATPNQALIGYEPRDLFSMENKNLSATSGSVASRPDYLESSMRARLLAKEAIVQAIIEHRIAEAANSKHQQYDPQQLEKMEDGQKVDLWREPEDKSTSGWRGPAETLRLYRKHGKAVIMWKGFPMLVPLRHIRPHIGFVWMLSVIDQNCDESCVLPRRPDQFEIENQKLVNGIMELVENFIPGQVFTYGLVWNRTTERFILVPADLDTNPPEMYVLSQRLARDVLDFSLFAGVQFGVNVQHSDALPNIVRGRMVVWTRMERKHYEIMSVNPHHKQPLTSRGSSVGRCFILIYGINTEEDEHDPKVLDEPELDIWSPSTIPWTPAPRDDDFLDLFPSPPTQPQFPPSSPLQPPVLPFVPPAPPGISTTLLPPAPVVQPDIHTDISLPAVPESPLDRTRSPRTPTVQPQQFDIGTPVDSPGSFVLPLRPSDPPVTPKQEPVVPKSALRSRSRSPACVEPTQITPKQIAIPSIATPEVRSRSPVPKMQLPQIITPPSDRAIAVPHSPPQLLPPTPKKVKFDDDESTANSSSAPAATTAKATPISPSVSPGSSVLPLRPVKSLNDDTMSAAANSTMPATSDEPFVLPIADETPPVSPPPGLESLQAPEQQSMLDDSQASTIPYDDQEDLYSSTWIGLLQKMKPAERPHVEDIDDFDYLAHAMHDARQVLLATEYETPWRQSEAWITISGPWSECRCFYYDILEDQCFSVSQDDFLTPKEVEDNIEAVQKADHKEIASFIKHAVFKLDSVNNSHNTIDAVWVRKWIRRYPPEVKSRMCGRGFLDIQKTRVDRHSSTASALSHRLGITLAAQYGFDVEGFDVSTAFLQGLRFTEIAKIARELGIEVSEERQVWLRPPQNVWRHLRLLKFCTVADVSAHLYVLMLLKAMYGLVDGPLLFQLAFMYYLVKTMKFTKSLHDDNMLFMVDTEPSVVLPTWQGSSSSQQQVGTRGDLLGLIIVHVDDLLVIANTEFIRWVQRKVEERFGKLKRHTLPFTWCGIVHERYLSRIDGHYHYFLHQLPYLKKLKPIQFSQQTGDCENLCDADYSQFRSLTMSLLWLCKTRGDILTDVVLLQTEMHIPLGKHFKRINTVLRNAVANGSMNGLHFRYVGQPRLVQVTDSGHITQNSCYPIEGRMILLMTDYPELRRGSVEHYSGEDTQFFGGSTCVLYMSSKKAQRVSYSTSHSETNPAVSCMAISNLIAARISELDYYKRYGRFVTVKDLLRINLKGENVVPLDMCTDAMNLFELIVHKKSLPNDKHHRVGVLSLREDRLVRRLRNVIHLPTTIMLADPLTKQMTSPVFMNFATTGIWKTRTDREIRLKRGCKRPSTYTEQELEQNDFEEAGDTIGEELTLEEDADVERELRKFNDRAERYAYYGIQDIWNQFEFSF